MIQRLQCVAWIQIVDCDCTLKYCSMISLGRPPSVKYIVVLIKFSLFCNFLEDSHERIVFYCTIHRSVILKNYQLYSLLRSFFIAAVRVFTWMDISQSCDSTNEGTYQTVKEKIPMLALTLIITLIITLNTTLSGNFSVNVLPFC